jgi:hypothetical protein
MLQRFPKRSPAYLVLRRSLLRQRHRRRHAYRQVVPSHIVHPRLLHHRPYPRLLQVLDLILIRRRQMRAHRPMVSRDHYPTSPRRLLLVDSILNMNALLLTFLAQRVGVVILAHTADVPDGVGWEHVGCAAGGVLGAAAGDEFRVAVLQQVVVEGHVFGFGEDRVVEFEVIFLEHGIVAGDGRVSIGAGSASVVAGGEMLTLVLGYLGSVLLVLGQLEQWDGRTEQWVL